MRDARGASGLEHPQRPGRVRLVGRHGVRDRARHAPQSREVDDGLDSCHRVGENGLIEDRPLDEADVERLEVGALAGGEVVDDDDVVACLEGPLAEVGTDEACPSGDENAHRSGPSGKRWSLTLSRGPAARAAGPVP